MGGELEGVELISINITKITRIECLIDGGSKLIRFTDDSANYSLQFKIHKNAQRKPTGKFKAPILQKHITDTIISPITGNPYPMGKELYNKTIAWNEAYNILKSMEHLVSTYSPDYAEHIESERDHQPIFVDLLNICRSQCQQAS